MKRRGVGRKVLLVGVLLAIVVLAAGCGKKKGARAQEQQENTQAVSQLIHTQPVPQFDYSQLRQNMIELATAEAEGVQTTSFFFNQGVQEPIGSCPSIGYPIPASFSLTAPEQFVGSGNGNLALPQAEPTGVYPGDTTGTKVICVDAQGLAYAKYWEGFVDTETGPARWNPTTHTVELTGPPSFTFTKGK